MRRGTSGETQFSSDSFLDIIANLVGILIILILLGGLAASRAPVEEEPVAEVPAFEPPPVVPPEEPSPLPAATTESAPLLASIEKPQTTRPHFTPTLVEPPLKQPAEPEPESKPALTAAEAARQAAQFERQLAALKGRLTEYDVATAAKQLQSTQSQLAQQAAAMRELQQVLVAEEAAARTSVTRLSETDGEYQSLRARLIAANRELQELATAEPQTERLDLRINPIGRRDARAKELLFLVSGKESLYLPIEELFEQIMRRESGNIDLTLRSNNQRGTVGPIDGVSSKYLLKLIPVAVQTPRGGSVSLSNRPITQLLIEPEPNAPREPATTALQPGGLFAGKLLSAPSGTIVRLLIRTDSFEEGRELTSYARQRGFRVDAQPLGPAEPVRITIGAGSNALAQ
jgi:hypothetical protein